jgi:hypothetical protein
MSRVHRTMCVGRRRLLSTSVRSGASLLGALPVLVPVTLVRAPPPGDAPLDGLAAPAAIMSPVQPLGTASARVDPAAVDGGSLSTLYWAERRPRTAAVVWVNRKEREIMPCARLVAYMERVLGLHVLVPSAVAPLVGGTVGGGAARAGSVTCCWRRGARTWRTRAQPYDPDDAAGLARTVRTRATATSDRLIERVGESHTADACVCAAG